LNANGIVPKNQCAKQYIPLANHDNSSLNTIKEHFEEIAKILQSYPACTLTFLEIPVYSIYIPNKYKGHKEPNQFKEQDGLVPWLGVLHLYSV
jgi:hypothetical protein